LDKYRTDIEKFILDLKQFYLEGGNKVLSSMGLDIIDANKIKELPKSKELFLTILSLENAVEWKKQLNNYNMTEQFFLPLIMDERQIYIDALQQLSLELKDPYKQSEEIEKKILNFGNIDNVLFYKGEDEYDGRSSIIESKLSSNSNLGLWIDVSHLLNNIYKAGLGDVIKFAEKHSLTREINELVMYGYYREWAHKILRENDLLATSNRHTFEANLKSFKKIDSQLGSLYAREQALALSKNLTINGIGGKVSDKTEMHLIRNEVRKQKRHIHRGRYHN